MQRCLTTCRNARSHRASPLSALHSHSSWLRHVSKAQLGCLCCHVSSLGRVPRSAGNGVSSSNDLLAPNLHQHHALGLTRLRVGAQARWTGSRIIGGSPTVGQDKRDAESVGDILRRLKMVSPGCREDHKHIGQDIRFTGGTGQERSRVGWSAERVGHSGPCLYDRPACQL